MNSDTFLDLQQKTILVTGASSGIGKETAILASKFGARVALVARNRESLDSVLAEMHGDGHVIRAFDLTEADGISAIVKSVAEEIQGLDGLVHSAGVHSAVPLRSVSSVEVRRVLEVNVTSALMLAKAFRQKQVRRSSGSMVLLSSAVGLVGQPGVSAYSAAKGAVLALTRSLALELARENIRVNCVCPGVVETPMTADLQEKIGKESFQRIAEAHPLGLGAPSDVANAILFLLSGASRWITGSALPVDGGYTAQ